MKNIKELETFLGESLVSCLGQENVTTLQKLWGNLQSGEARLIKEGNKVILVMSQITMTITSGNHPGCELLHSGLQIAKTGMNQEMRHRPSGLILASETWEKALARLWSNMFDMDPTYSCQLLEKAEVPGLDFCPGITTKNVIHFIRIAVKEGVIMPERIKLGNGDTMLFSWVLDAPDDWPT